MFLVFFAVTVAMDANSMHIGTAELQDTGAVPIPTAGAETSQTDRTFSPQYTQRSKILCREHATTRTPCVPDVLKGFAILS